MPHIKFSRWSNDPTLKRHPNQRQRKELFVRCMIIAFCEEAAKHEA